MRNGPPAPGVARRPKDMSTHSTMGLMPQPVRRVADRTDHERDRVVAQLLDHCARTSTVSFLSVRLLRSSAGFVHRLAEMWPVFDTAAAAMHGLSGAIQEFVARHVETGGLVRVVETERSAGPVPASIAPRVPTCITGPMYCTVPIGSRKAFDKTRAELRVTVNVF